MQQMAYLSTPDGRLGKVTHSNDVIAYLEGLLQQAEPCHQAISIGDVVVA